MNGLQNGAYLIVNTSIKHYVVIRNGRGRSSSVERPLSIIGLREVACSTHAVSTFFFRSRVESIFLIYGPMSRHNLLGVYNFSFQVLAIIVLIARRSGGESGTLLALCLSVRPSVRGQLEDKLSGGGSLLHDLPNNNPIVIDVQSFRFQRKVGSSIAS